MPAARKWGQQGLRKILDDKVRVLPPLRGVSGSHENGLRGNLVSCSIESAANRTPFEGPTLAMNVGEGRANEALHGGPAQPARVGTKSYDGEVVSDNAGAAGGGMQTVQK